MELGLKCDCGNEDKIHISEDIHQEDMNENFNVTCCDGYTQITCKQCNKMIEITGC